MNNLWEVYMEYMDYTADQIADLIKKGYVINLRESAKLTGYHIKNEFEYEGDDYLVMKHDTEALEDSVF